MPFTRPIPRAHHDRRDREARQLFEAYYRAHYARVRAFAARRTATAADADDVTEETFLIAWRRLDIALAAEPATAWLMGVARRVIANRRRNDERRARMYERLATVSSEMLGGTHDPEHHMIERHEMAHVHTLVDQLPPFDRELIRLAAFDELSYEEMAIVLGCRTSHVRTRLHRARERLRRMQDASLIAATHRD